jgi:AcrR family transcriptional regulator
VPRPQVHSDATILTAARAEFAANGFSAASMEQIAASAGTTKPTLYTRFGDKETLYERTIRERARALLDHLFASYDEAAELTVHEMIDTATRAYLDFFADEPEDFDLLFHPDRSRPATTLADQVLDAIINGITQLVDQVLARSRREAPHAARLIAAMMVGAAHNALRQVSHDPHLDRDQAAQLVTSFCFSAVKGLDPRLIDEQTLLRPNLERGSRRARSRPPSASNNRRKASR